MQFLFINFPLKVKNQRFYKYKNFKKRLILSKCLAALI